MKSTFTIVLLTLISFIRMGDSFAQESETRFIVPDSIIAQACIQEINFENKVFGIPLWPNGLPDSAITHSRSIYIFNRTSDLNEFGLNRAINYVSEPGMMIFPAQSDTLAPAIVIFPGGAYQRVVIDKEGIDVAQRLNQYGITAIVVAYRSLQSEYWSLQLNIPPVVFQAMVTDAQRAMRIVRSRAAEFSIDPNKIGVMGFSAGGTIAASVVVDTIDAKPEQPDEIDSFTARPDFGCLTYAVILDSIINKINENTPPCYLVSTKDDGAASPVYVQKFYDRLVEKNVPAGIIIFQSGGHGYGLGVGGGEVTKWPAMAVEWMNSMGITDAETSVDFQAHLIDKKVDDFNLHNCYPNPFNPTTTISYELAHKEHVRLLVTDILGKQIELLVDEIQPAGQHLLKYNASTMASGTYFLKLEAGDFVQTRKMMLIK